MAISSTDRKLHKVLMDAAIGALNDMFSYILRQKIQAGAIVVFHPFGRDLEFKPHIHVLATERGFDKKGKFVPKQFIHARAMRKTWQYHVLTKLKAKLPKTRENSKLIHSLFQLYDGFYVYLPEKSRIRSKKEIAKYVARYVRHPAIANYRLAGYDGEYVTFRYKDSEGVIHYKTMKVFDFIQALIQHIPDPQFKMIRHYGAYCRKWKRIFVNNIALRSITQTKLYDFRKNGINICPVCGHEMELIEFRKKGPLKS
jgi:hypothetical protein